MKRIVAVFSITLLFSLSVYSQAYTINTIAGNGIIGFSGDGGQALAAELAYPVAITVDNNNNVYFVDLLNKRVRKINGSNIITTIAGNGVQGYSGDSVAGTSAELGAPSGVSVDAQGNIYIADQTNNRIRKLSSSGIITTIAGNGIMAFSGDGGLAIAAELSYPAGVVTDNIHNIYVADMINNRIREINTSNVIFTIAGNGVRGYSGDGIPATDAEFSDAEGLALDYSGNIYVVDETVNRVREINTNGIINTIAGNGIMGFSGDNGPASAAEIAYPEAVAVDLGNNVYFIDGINERVRKIDTSGIISTIAGDGTQGFYGDGGPATAAKLGSPLGIAVDTSGNVYIADQTNNRIRKLTPDRNTGINTYTELNNFTVFPNPSTGIFSIQSSVVSGQSSVEIYNVLGEKVLTKILPCLPTRQGSAQGDNLINLTEQPSGVYLYRVIAENGSLLGEGKFIVQR
jgi:trimeric autotransporter adhesin